MNYNKPFKEWKDDKKWNPFNSHKLLAHVERWKRIKKGETLPPPVLVTIDPSNVCNHNCEWCNASYIMSNQNNVMTEENIKEIVNLLANWEVGGYRVNAACIAGGGEPLTNPNTALLINELVENKIQVGVVTNGYFIERFLEPLSKCTWVGVSVDAGSKKTFNNLKGLSGRSGNFDKIISNIKLLVEFSKKNNLILSKKHPAYGVSYKYLLSKENIREVYDAVLLAKEIGCKNFHLRPSSTPWNLLNSENEISFTKDEVSTYQEQIEKALELDDEKFNVYGVTHKFDGQFNSCNRFEKCYAIFMTGVFMPSKEWGKIDFGLCCDRRGDDRLLLLKGAERLSLVRDLWGSKAHWDTFDKIDVQNHCPRCTYQPHNQIYEQVILKDSMTYIFI